MTLLKVLKEGGQITFPSGYILRGDPANNYIDTLIDSGDGVYSDGLRILDKNGIREALNDKKKYEADLKKQS